MHFTDADDIYNKIRDWYNGYTIPTNGWKYGKGLRSLGGDELFAIKRIHIITLTQSVIGCIVDLMIMIKKLLIQEDCKDGVLISKLKNMLDHGDMVMPFDWSTPLHRYDWF